MNRWKLSCPYCNSIIGEGTGYLEIPSVWMPLYRCQICGKLVVTGSKEFLTMTNEERLCIKATLNNCKYIAMSIDRTNNKEYVEFLEDNDYTMYELTDEVVQKFKNVDFNKMSAMPSQEAERQLLDMGVIISENDKDEKTGGYKQEILHENQINYDLNKRCIKYGNIAGLITGIIACITIADINPNSYIFVLGIFIGFICFALTYFLTYKYLSKNIKKYKDINYKNASQNDTKEKYLNPTFDDTQSNKYQNEIANNKIQDIKALKTLYDQGIITQEEYKEKSLKIIDKK